MQIAATTNADLATVLLELALDEARRRKRLAAFLLAERTRRAGGDAGRYPQPRMAEELGVTLRTYQGWEAARRTPRPHNLDTLVEVLAFDYYASDVAGAAPASSPGEDDPADALRRELESLRRRVDRLEQQRRARPPAARPA